MFVNQLTVYGKAATPIYARLAEMYTLPSIAALLAAVQDSNALRGFNKTTQIYLLDNLREQNRRSLFQMRFIGEVGSTHLNTLFISVNKSVHQLALDFPARGDRHISKEVLNWLKSLAHQGYEIEFKIQGYAEADSLIYISESYLSAFDFNEAIGRYFHKRDNWEGKRR